MEEHEILADNVAKVRCATGPVMVVKRGNEPFVFQQDTTPTISLRLFTRHDSTSKHQHNGDRRQPIAFRSQFFPPQGPP